MQVHLGLGHKIVGSCVVSWHLRVRRVKVGVSRVRTLKLRVIFANNI